MDTTATHGAPPRHDDAQTTLRGRTLRHQVEFVVAQLSEVTVRRLCRGARVTDHGFAETPRDSLIRCYGADIGALLGTLYSPELVRVLGAVEIDLPGGGQGHLRSLERLDRAALQRLACALFSAPLPAHLATAQGEAVL